MPHVNYFTALPVRVMEFKKKMFSLKVHLVSAAQCL